MSIDITWTVFRANFWEKNFFEDMHGKKKIEFLKLKQGNSTVVEYAARFEELVKYCPCYNNRQLKYQSVSSLRVDFGQRPSRVSSILRFVSFLY